MKCAEVGRGLCNKGLSPLKLIHLDCKETKEYNYYCNFIEHKITSNRGSDCTLEVAPSRTNLQQHFTSFPLKLSFINFVILALLTLFAFSFSACSKPFYKIQTQEVLIPIKCNLELPLKPKENGSFESHKGLAVYYKQVEQIAKDCTKNKY